MSVAAKIPTFLPTLHPEPGTSPRVLVVDDSVVMRQLITRILVEEASCHVVGTARNGADALEKVEKYQPDLVTLDVEMPVMGGLEALRVMRAKHPQLRVIMCSSLTAQGAKVTLEALFCGADDYVTKHHSNQMHEGAYEALSKSLAEKVKSIFGGSIRDGKLPARGDRAISHPVSGELWDKSRQPEGWAFRPEVVALGVSTGGPAALAAMLPAVPASFRLPIVIVQHMPPLFTQLLAERLSKLCKIPVVEGHEGMEVLPGRAVLAPGNYHMQVQRRNGVPVITLNQGAHENSCRPAVDVLFRSIADVFGGSVLAAILTGMGQDGLEGVRVLKTRGAKVLAQDQQTSVVWGMPGAVVSAGLADAVLPLHDIGSAISRCA